MFFLFNFFINFFNPVSKNILWGTAKINTSYFFIFQITQYIYSKKFFNICFITLGIINVCFYSFFLKKLNKSITFVFLKSEQFSLNEKPAIKIFTFLVFNFFLIRPIISFPISFPIELFVFLPAKITFGFKPNFLP